MINQDSIDAENARREAEARARAEAEERARREAAERAAREAEERAARERAAAVTAARNAFAMAIYYDYDKSDLKPEARATLDAKLPLLRANANVRIRIAGHTDERGSDAYNMSLGQRRAAAAKRHLVDQGIAADRIETVSFGEDRPSAMGSDESAWSQNRRAEFEIIVGGETLRLP
jgi:peptidoglycan-associated lipoprotein